MGSASAALIENLAAMSERQVFHDYFNSTDGSPWMERYFEIVSHLASAISVIDPEGHGRGRLFGPAASVRSTLQSVSHCARSLLDVHF